MELDGVAERGSGAACPDTIRGPANDATINATRDEITGERIAEQFWLEGLKLRPLSHIAFRHTQCDTHKIGREVRAGTVGSCRISPWSDDV